MVAKPESFLSPSQHRASALCFVDFCTLLDCVAVLEDPHRGCIEVVAVVGGVVAAAVAAGVVAEIVHNRNKRGQASGLLELIGHTWTKKFLNRLEHHTEDALW